MRCGMCSVFCLYSKLWMHLFSNALVKSQDHVLHCERTCVAGHQFRSCAASWSSALWWSDVAGGTQSGAVRRGTGAHDRATGLTPRWPLRSLASGIIWGHYHQLPHCAG